jgi:hypothetical protein
MILVERVESLLALLADVDKARVAQNGEVVRNGGLGEADFFHDFANRKPTATALAHDFLAGVVGNRFGK